MTVFHILVADDDIDHRFLIQRAVLDSVPGADVATVDDGEAVLDYLHRRGDYHDRPRPHLLLLDLRMPGIDGLEVLRRLKSDPELRRIPVTVLSSSDREQDVITAYDLGTNTYVVKNSDGSQFLSDLRDASVFWSDVATLPTPPP
jgi:CheY-like chemotaxis protein